MAKVIYVIGGRWPGALVIVEEERPWGVIGYMPIPEAGGVAQAPVRISTEEFRLVGEVDTEI